MASMAMQIREKNPTSRIYVFDSTKGGLRSLASMPGARYYAMPSEELQDGQDDALFAIIREIGLTLGERQQMLVQSRSQQGENFSQAQFVENLDLMCIFVDDIKNFVDKVTNRCLGPMGNFCRKAQGLGLMVFAAGRIADLALLNSQEAVTMAIVSNQKGIGLGGSAAVHSYLRNDLSYKEKELEAGEGNAYLFDNGHCRKIKLPE